MTIGDAVYSPQDSDVRLQIGATDLDLQSDSEIDIAQLDDNAGTIRLDSGVLDVRVAALPTARKAVPYPQYVRTVVLALAAILLLAWTVFPFFWILLTSLKTPGDILSVPPKFVFAPTIDNYLALVIGDMETDSPC